MIITYIIIGIGIGLMILGVLLNMLCIITTLRWDKLDKSVKQELRNGAGLNSIFTAGTMFLFGGSITTIAGLSAIIYNLLNQ